MYWRNERAEAASRVKREFLAGVSREIRTVLFAHPICQPERAEEFVYALQGDLTEVKEHDCPLLTADASQPSFMDGPVRGCICRGRDAKCSGLKTPASSLPPGAREGLLPVTTEARY